MFIQPLHAIDATRFDRPDLLRQVAAASRALAELKGLATSMPNEGMLINTLSLQEAKDSSAIESIVTTHDQLYREEPGGAGAGTAAKEVLRYRQALQCGFARVKESGLLTLSTMLEVQEALECNQAGLRRLPGTTLRNDLGEVVYTPPQSGEEVRQLMSDLERFIHDEPAFDTDPLIKMALIHHQFESIHPFYDGNGRTGRIVNVLYLVKEGLLDIPVLYLSRHIVRTKGRYYSLLQAVRERDAWEDWVLYKLQAVESTARETIATTTAIKTLLLEMKHRIRANYRFYSQDLINNLFSHPYTKIEFVQRDLGVTRVTATKYLNELVAGGVLEKRRIGTSNYYVNVPLYNILSGTER